jgi:citrate synthase
MGDAHGGAAFDCMQMITDGVALARRESVSLQDAARRAVAGAKSAGRRLPGMGHRVHTEDPRTRVLFGMAQTYGVARDGVAFMQALEAAAREQIRPLPINIDGALSAILYDMGFLPPVGKLIFIIGRVAGVTAQVMEEHLREKPMRVRIPVEYDGPPPRSIE